MSFYLDGTAFAHKTNPFEQACAPKGRIWRKKSEGFHLGCTSKGCKEGTGGRVLRLMVAISYGKGVIACEPYERMCGAYFANFIDTNFPRMLEEAFLNAHGYFYLQARKKGLLKRQDCEKRVAFAKHYKRHYDKKFWTEKVSFYLDGKAFAHKTNPFEQACAPKGRIWRKKSEGFHLGCTSKGCKEGTGGRVLRLMVAISYGKGVIACEPYERMCGAYFANFIDTNFPRMLEEAAKGGERIFNPRWRPVAEFGCSEESHVSSAV